jgi:hypothetical protein
LGYFWPLKIKYKLNNYKHYSDEVLQVLNLNEKEGLILYLETWQTDRMYEYEQFTGLIESPRKDFNYVNFSKKNGRKINNGDACNISFFFYGGETTFGYNVTDEQTFASFFKDILDIEFPENNYCVYNFGRGSYFSTQENILFQQHLLKKRFESGDFIFFIDGVNEGGNKDVLGTSFLKHIYISFHQKYWNLYKHAFPIFVSTLPIVQVVELFFKFRKDSQRQDILEDTNNDEELLRVFQNNVDIRIGICKKFALNCYSFLQPFSGLHGLNLKKISKNIVIEDNEKKINQKKYLILKKTKNIFDITASLDNEKELSYVDKVNYSPPANKSIAKYIFQIIEENLKN